MIRNVQEKILYQGKRLLKAISYDLKNKNGVWKNQEREIYIPGDAAAILLYHKIKKTIIFVRQLRIASYLNGNTDGLLLEVCAGKLDNDDAETCAIREVEEETGYKIPSVQKVFEAYIAPGAITEIVHFFVAEYSEDMKISAGGGLEEEGEEIELIEWTFDKAYQALEKNEIRDAKTILLVQYLKLNESVLLS